MTDAARKNDAMKPLKLSITQRKILEWLVLYPEVHINKYDDGSVSWSAWWRDESARLDCQSIAGSKIAPDPVPATDLEANEGATPRLIKASFTILDGLALIYSVDQRERTDCMSGMLSYTISPRGKAVLSELVIRRHPQ